MLAYLASTSCGPEDYNMREIRSLTDAVTLNITLATPWYVIQASDRRMVSVPDGKLCDDEANKGLVLSADDGVFSVTFTGIGRCSGQRVDLWLAERMLDEGIPELPISQGVKTIARLAADWFGTFPEELDKRHTFVVAGWEWSGERPKAAVWTVSNCSAEDGRMLESAKDSFDVRKHTVRSSRIFLYSTGLCDAISRNDKRRLKAALRLHSDPNSVEEALVYTIRSASAKPKWAWGINPNVLAIMLTPSGEAKATHYPVSGGYLRYVPLLVCYEAGRDYAVGDGWVRLSKPHVLRFGPMMVVLPPSRPGTPESQVDFGFRFTNAKHKAEIPGELALFAFSEIVQKPRHG